MNRAPWVFERKNCQRDPSGVGNGMKRDSGRSSEQLGTARRGSLRGKLPERPERQWNQREKGTRKASGTVRRGSLRGKLPERPKRQWKWKRKNGQKVSVAARRGSLREKMSERPERRWKWSEKRLRKVFGAVRNRAPRVFEREIA